MENKKMPPRKNTASLKGGAGLRGSWDLTYNLCRQSPDETEEPMGKKRGDKGGGNKKRMKVITKCRRGGKRKGMKTLFPANEKRGNKKQT